MKRTMKKLASLITLRRQTGKTQADVAADLGLSKSTYAAWEVGRNLLNSEQIITLAEYFGCTPNDILGWQNAKEEESVCRAFESAGLTQEERYFLSLYNLLAPNNRTSIMDLMQSCTKQRRPKI